MDYKEINISTSSAFIPIYKYRESGYSNYFKIMESLNSKDAEAKACFTNLICQQIVFENLIGKMAEANTELVKMFADLFIKNYSVIRTLIPQKALLVLLNSPELAAVEGWKETMKVNIIIDKIQSKNFQYLAIFCEEVADVVEKANNATLTEFITGVIKPISRSRMRASLVGIGQLRTSLNKVLANCCLFKPIIFAEINLNLFLRKTIKRFDIFAPGPEYLLRHPEKCSVASSITISLIIGQIVAIIENNEDIETYFEEIFALAPHQTKDCLLFYILHHNQTFVQRIEEYNGIAKIFAFENRNRSILEMPFFVNCVDKSEVDFFEQPTSEKMNALIDKGIDLERVIGLGILNTGNLVFDIKILINALEKVLNRLEINLKNLEYTKFIKAVRTSLTIIEAIVLQIGFHAILVEPISIIIDNILISHLSFEKGNATFITVEVERLMNIINVLVLKNEDIFVDFALSNKEKLSSLWIVTVAKRSFIEQQLEVTSMFAESLNQPSWIALHLATEMIIRVVESIVEEDETSAIRVAYSVLKFCNDCLILFSLDIVGKCYFLKVLKKLFKCSLFGSVFVEYNAFFIPLMEILDSDNLESILLVFKVVLQLMETDCVNSVALVMFYYPPIEVIKKLILDAEKFSDVEEDLLVSALEEFMFIISNCPYTKPLIGEESEVSIFNLKDFINENFRTCHERVIASIKGQNIPGNSDASEVFSLLLN